MYQINDPVLGMAPTECDLNKHQVPIVLSQIHKITVYNEGE